MGKKKSHRQRPMTKKRLLLWRDNMGYSLDDCSHELGVTAEEWKAWESGDAKIPRYIGLACSALALGMNPYGEEG